MSEVIEKVEIGVDIVVNESAAKKVVTELDKVKKAGEQAQWTTGGAGGIGGAEAVKKAGEAAEQAGSKIDNALTKAGSLADALANKLEGAFGPSVASRWIRTVGQGLDAVGSKAAAIKALLSSLVPAHLKDAITTSMAAGWKSVLRLMLSAKNLMIGIVQVGARFAGPIAAVVATVGGLVYAWREAKNESTAALKAMEEAGKKLEKLRPRFVAQTNRFMAHENRVGSMRVDHDLEDARNAARGTDLDPARFGEGFAKVESALSRIRQKQQEIANTQEKSDERVIGSELARADQKKSLLDDEKRALETLLDLTRQKFEIERQELQLQRDRVRSKIDEAKAAQEILRQQENARLSTRERLGRLEASGQLSAFEKLYGQFKSSGDVRTGIAAEGILGGRIEGVGAAAAKAMEGRFKDDFLDELGPKLEEQQAKLLAKVAKAAGGFGDKAIQALIDGLEGQDTVIAAKISQATDDAKRDMARVTAAIDDLIKAIRAAALEIEDLKLQANMGGS